MLCIGSMLQVWLSGQGTRKDPYLIADVDDLILFRDCVNSGESFEGKQIRQTSDLCLSRQEAYAYPLDSP